MFGRRATVVGRGSTVRGSLDCGDDDAKVSGRLEGALTSKTSVLVAAEGYVEGDVTAPVVVVGGVVEGTVTAEDRLQLLSTGCIRGDAIYGTLEVERGGVVKGRTMTMTSRPPSQAPPADDTLQLPAAGEGDRVTAEYGIAELALAEGDGDVPPEGAPSDQDEAPPTSEP